MANINIPLDEAISLLRGNMRLNEAIKSIEATENGPKIGIKPPVLPTIFITVKFDKFEDSTAVFKLEGFSPLLSPIVNLVKLPDGVALSGDKLSVKPDVLINKRLKMKGLSVTDMAWENGSYRIETKVAETQVA